MKRVGVLGLAMLFLAAVLWTSAPFIVSAQAAPAAPSGFQVSSYSSSQINLSWNAVTGATSYQVYRSTGTSTSYAWIATVSTRSYKDTELKAATRYNYKVRALKGSSASSFTAVKSTYTRPAVPMGLASKTISTTQIDLSWKTVTGATSYQVYRSIGTSTNYVKIATVTSPKFSNKGCTAGTKYNYKVRAVNSAGAGGFSAVKTTYTRPLAPTGVTAAKASGSKIIVSWRRVTGATSYKIYVSKNGGAFAYKATTTALTYSHTGLTAGSYRYKVSAVTAGFESALSLPTVSISTVQRVTGVSLDQTAMTLTAGETFTLHATIAPSNAANKSVTWSSSNEGVASVSNGVVTAKAAGTATIIVRTADGGKTATCMITVNEYLADGVYTFLIKDGGKAMNLNASSDAQADKNGTRVTIWTDTGHSTQRFRVLNIGNHRCRIYAISSSNGTNRALNLNRNSSIPIDIGIKITLWQVTASGDQEFIASKTADGYYKIAPAAKPELVIGCNNVGTNGTDLTLQQDNGSGVQLWQARPYTQLPSDQVEEAVYNKLMTTLKDQYSGITNWNYRTFKGTRQCLAFANIISNALFGTYALSYYGNEPHVYSNVSGLSAVGILDSTGKLGRTQISQASIIDLMHHARPGDLIQVDYKDASRPQHTMVYLSRDDDAIYVADEVNGDYGYVRWQFKVTYSTMFNTYSGISLYTATDYNLK